MVKQTIDQNDQQAHYSQTVYGGLKGSAAALLAGGAGAAFAQRRGIQAWTGLTLPLKAFALTVVGTAGFIINADKAARDFELQKYALGSGTELEKTSRQQERLEREAGIAGGAQRQLQPVSTSEAVLEWAKENRWTAVGLSWAASMVGSGAYIASSPLTFAQKLVQARMVAQGLTVAVLLASAGLTAIPNSAGKTDNEIKQEERERGMYAWKKDSPHAQHEKAEVKTA
ncbi:hypothetical protein JCM11251_005129 [Rhodosporidiobolus azoricus]